VKHFQKCMRFEGVSLLSCSRIRKERRMLTDTCFCENLFHHLNFTLCFPYLHRRCHLHETSSYGVICVQCSPFPEICLVRSLIQRRGRTVQIPLSVWHGQNITSPSAPGVALTIQRGKWVWLAPSEKNCSVCYVTQRTTYHTPLNAEVHTHVLIRPLKCGGHTPTGVSTRSRGPRRDSNPI
jgi:hypothetical protein